MNAPELNYDLLLDLVKRVGYYKLQQSLCDTLQDIVQSADMDPGLKEQLMIIITIKKAIPPINYS